MSFINIRYGCIKTLTTANCRFNYKKAYLYVHIIPFEKSHFNALLYKKLHFRKKFLRKIIYLNTLYDKKITARSAVI